MGDQSLNVFEPYPNLPLDVQEVILNDLSFIDLFNACLTNKTMFQICSSDQYFQQRLLTKGVPIQRYQQLISAQFSPRDSYILALIQSKMIHLDPTILIYLQKSDILFPGLEYFIGLGKMGVRAINLNRADYLLYVLKLYPKREELRQILGTLFMRYLNNRNTSIFNQIGQPLLDQLFEINSEIQSPYHAEEQFYPDGESSYRYYKMGLDGLPIKAVLEGDPNRPYLYGLIDGHHDLLFETVINKYTKSLTPELLYAWIIGFRNYIARRGTIQMVKIVSSFDIRSPTSLLPIFASLSIRHEKYGLMIGYAVEGDNLPVVNFFLVNAMDEIEGGGTWMRELGLIPRSTQMLRLLTSNGVSVNNQAIFVGAVSSCNYDLLLSTFGPNWYDQIEYIDEMVREPLFYAINDGSSYLVSAYFTKYHESYEWTGEGTDLEYLVTGHLVSNGNLYKEELMLSLGYQPDDSAKESLSDSAANHGLKSVFGINLNSYPNLERIVLNGS